jgi:metal transporter CNNM
LFLTNTAKANGNP